MRKIILSIIVFTCLVKNSVNAQYWSALGEGIGLQPWQYQNVDGPTDGYDAPVTGHSVASLCIYNGELYAAGCHDANGPAGNIAKWNGSTWSPIGIGVYTVGGGGFDSWINALLVYNGELYVAGRFTNAGNIEANNIAKWDGTEWSAVGDGLGTYGYSVSSLVIYEGELYAGGHFYNAGGVQVKNIAKWNGTSWSPVGTGIDVYTDNYPYGAVNSFAVFNGELYAGGYFDTTSVNTTSNIVKWDGSTWSAVGTGLDSMVFSLAVYNGELYAGGYFSDIRKWNGSEWSPLSLGINGSVYSLLVDNGSLFAGGYFDTAGGVSVNNITKWNGTVWSALGKGVDKGVVCMTTHNNALFVGGHFNIAGNIWANQVAKWTEQCTSPPAQPDNITAQLGGCQDRYAVYFIEPVSDTEDYTWTLPSGWSGSSVSNRIAVLAGTGAGTISVSANNPCGSSDAQTIAVTAPGAVPLHLDAISGKNFVCPNIKQTYSVSPVSGAASYVWTLPDGWTGSSITNTIITTTGSNGGIISVKARNNCDESNTQTLAVTVNNSAPQFTDDITGGVSVNVDQLQSYSVSSVNGAANYNWSLSGGGVITSGQNSNSITVNWHTAGTYTLSVNASNECGTNPDKTITIKVTVADENPYSLQVFPNPSTGKFYLKAIRIQDKMIDVEVLSMSGQIVLKSRRRQVTNDFSELINLNKMPRGLYIVKIIVDDKVFSRRIAILQ